MPSPENIPTSTDPSEFTVGNVEEAKPTDCVYFIQCQGLTKIGRTNNLATRVRQLESEDYPSGVNGFGPIEGIYYVRTDNSRYLEALMHSLMEPEHVRGEWFFIKDGDMEAIKSIFGDSMGFAVGGFTGQQEIYSVQNTIEEWNPDSIWTD